MAPLASVEDLQVRLGRTFTEDELPRINALLADASALIRGYTKQQFTLVEDDEIVLRPVGSTIRLPQKPVISVDMIWAQSGFQPLSEFALAAWTFDGIDKINLFGGNEQIVNYPEWWYQYEGTNTYKVRYSHGYEEVPDDILAVACGMVSRIVTSPTPIEGMVSERIGQYFYQMQQNTGSAGGIVRMTSEDRATLDNYRKKATTIQMVS